MEFFNEFGILPTEGHLKLLRYLLVLTYAIHLPYLGMVLGATILSLAFNMRDRDVPNSTFARMAKDLMDLVVSNRLVVFGFGVLPLLVLWLNYGQWLYTSSATTMGMLAFGAIVIAVSFGPITSYRGTLYEEGRNSDVNFGLGAIGLATLLLGTYVLIGSIVRFNDPERWHLAQNPIRLLISFNIIWKFVLFLLSSLALTGCGMLFFFFNWAGRKPITDESYAKFAKNFGAGVGIAGLLLIPVIGFFYMVTTPIIAMSGAVYGILAAAVLLLFIIFAFLYGALVSSRTQLGVPSFVLFIVVFAMLSMVDQLTLVNATKEHSVKLISQAEERAAQIALEREAHRSASATVDVAKGEEIFNSVCVTCHRLDVKLVGPPLEVVLQKYRGKPDELASFVQSPKKTDPEYPPMPAPGLSMSDSRSVAAYVLSLIGDESGLSPAPEESEEKEATEESH